VIGFPGQVETQQFATSRSALRASAAGGVRDRSEDQTNDVSVEPIDLTCATESDIGEL